MIKSNTKQLRLPLDEWDIFNSYAENREDEELSPMSTHWTLTAASVADGFTIHGPKSADSTEDPYYKQAYVKPTLQARFADDTQESAPALTLKLRKRRKQNMSVDAGRDARAEDDGIRAILSAAHNQASKSKKAFGKMFSQLTNRDETEKENSKKFLLKSAGPVEGDARGARDHYFFTCSAMPTRPAKLKQTKSDYGQQNQKVLQISDPILITPPVPPPRSPPPTIGRATTFVRKTKALPLRPSPIPAI